MYQASIENRGDSKYYVTTRHGNFVMDTEGHGANPIDTLLASLCGCMGHMVRDYTREQGIICKGFRIAAETELNGGHTALAGISVSLDMQDTPLDVKQSAGLLEYVEKCYIHNTLKHNSEIRVALK